MVSEEALKVELEAIEKALNDLKVESRQQFKDLRDEMRPMIEYRALDKQMLKQHDEQIHLLRERSHEFAQKLMISDAVQKTHEARMDSHERDCRDNKDRIQKLEIHRSQAMAFFAGIQFISLLLFSLVVVYRDQLSALFGAS